jgi:diadenosine tetraphosphate (Ap4A) HIT family hydrolase
MASIFTRIINGELPGRFVYKDDDVVAFLTTAPIKPGHTLVVPREEVDHWIDMSPELAAKVMNVAQKVGQAIQSAFQPIKVGMIIAGLEVRHVHLHLVPIHAIADLNFALQNDKVTPEELDQAAEAIRAQLS